MPELPEVETVCRGLAPLMMNHIFTRVILRRPNLRIPFPDDFSARLEGKRIAALTRRAKYILVTTDDDTVLIAHLGMSGKIVASPHFANQYHPHDHVIFQLENGYEIIFNDPRRFGLMTLAAQHSLSSHPLLSSLGAEPLTDEFTADYLASKLCSRKTPIKTALMDNKIVVGIGNIYAAESLFRAKISPLRIASSLQPHEIEILIPCIKTVLSEAIASGGSTLRDYVRSSGEKGYFQHHFAVYGKEHTPCMVCGTEILRLTQGGRSTFYCDVCQQ